MKAYRSWRSRAKPIIKNGHGWRTGMPLGGIGAGRVEICSDGVFRNLSITNSFEGPIPDMDGSFFALWAKRSGKTFCKALALRSAYSIPLVNDITLTGCLPEAHLTYSDSQIPVLAHLVAHSSLVPHNANASSIPGIIFELELANPHVEKNCLVSGLFSWENSLEVGGQMVNSKSWDQKCLQGRMGIFTWDRRRYVQQKLIADKDVLGVLSSDPEAAKEHFAGSRGEQIILTEKAKDVEITFLPEWNALGEGFELWKPFSKTGRLPNTQGEGRVSMHHGCHWAAALAVRAKLKPGECRRIPFVVAWHHPEYDFYGGYDATPNYALHWTNAIDVARHLLKNRARIREDSRQISRQLQSGSLPEWMSSKLANDLHVMYTGTIYTKRGAISHSEAPANMGAMYGTIDQRIASSQPFPVLWPDLDAAELKLFGDTQTSTGRIFHDLPWGWTAGTMEKQAKTIGEWEHEEAMKTWPDLNLSYILQCIRHYRMTGDEQFMQRTWPILKKCLTFHQNQDPEGLGIAHMAGCTYDNQPWQGRSSFIGTLYLAVLRAMEETARALGETNLADDCAKRFVFTQKQTVRLLFNGKYFTKWWNPRNGERCDDCHLSQLAGQWFADLLGLGNVLPDKIIDSCMESMSRLCDRPDFLCAADQITMDGKPIKPFKNPRGQPTNSDRLSWIMYQIPFYYALDVVRGKPERGLWNFGRVNDLIIKQNHSPWCQYLTYDCQTGYHGGAMWYMTAPSSWSMLHALSGILADVPERMLRLAPRLPKGKKEFTVPILTTRFWGELKTEAKRNGWELDLRVTKTFGDKPFEANAIRVGLPGKSLQVGNASLSRKKHAPSGDLCAKAPFLAKPNARLCLKVVRV